MPWQLKRTATAKLKTSTSEMRSSLPYETATSGTKSETRRTERRPPAPHPLSDLLQVQRTSLAYYEDDKRDWKVQRDKLAELEKWVLETVSPHLAEVVCNPSEGVNQWYVSLKNRTGITPDVETRAARDKYIVVLQQTSKPPKDIKAWVRSWEEALTKARSVGVKVAETAIDW